MPKQIENKLKREAKKKNLSKKRENAYVFGTLFKIKKAKQKKNARSR